MKDTLEWTIMMYFLVPTAVVSLISIGRDIYKDRRRLPVAVLLKKR